ncbi:MAG: DUF6485 family protein [Candidatus Sumerlaeia bacterium]|nr:DUF6485 family protein [Candidatus Sumerlaeia bacterium]
MVEKCANYKLNLKRCNCTYEPCSRKGYCCECLHYHLQSGELPACAFSAEAERTYNRSVAYFIRCHKS